jgi:2-oxoglutarate ferredoxin oxidoreductase subunit gamma
MNEGKEVSWMPSYGPEMRGGTCNCTVVISDRPVGSPVIQSPRAVLAMNLPSLDKFEHDIKKDGVLLINSSLIDREPERDDISVIMVPANEIARELGSPRSANLVALGAYIGATDAVSMEKVEDIVRQNFAAKPKLVDINLEALWLGHEIGAAAMTAEVPIEEGV